MAADIGVVLRALAREYDAKYGERPGTKEQIRAVNIFLREHIKDRDVKLYVVASMFYMAGIPESSKALTKGQCSAILRFVHSQHRLRFAEYVCRLAREITNEKP